MHEKHFGKLRPLGVRIPWRVRTLCGSCPDTASGCPNTWRKSRNLRTNYYQEYVLSHSSFFSWLIFYNNLLTQLFYFLINILQYSSYSAIFLFFDWYVVIFISLDSFLFWLHQISFDTEFAITKKTNTTCMVDHTLCFVLYFRTKKKKKKLSAGSELSPRPTLWWPLFFFLFLYKCKTSHRSDTTTCRSVNIWHMPHNTHLIIIV
jgi:hypothetical protein